jgi:hypothetical protein
MRRTINLVRGTSTSATTYTGSVDLGNFANADGSKRALLRVSNAIHFNNGTITSVILEESADDSVFTTLKDFGTITNADNPCTIYTFNRYLRLAYTWTQGSATDDKGLRLSFQLWAYAPGNWGDAVPCRDEHMRGVATLLINTSKGFPATWPDQVDIAKMDLETSIRGHGVDPDDLFLDGHCDSPCVEGLETAGAWRVAYYAILNSQGPRREDWEKDLEKCSVEYEAQIKAFFESGRATSDLSKDQSPSDDEALRRPIRLVR